MNPFNKIRHPFRYSYFYASFALIVINFAFYILCLNIRSLPYYCSLNVISITKGYYFWQFVTYMFVHANWSHIISNMLGLLFFGVSLEKAIGSKEFLLFYFSTGILSGIFSFVIYLITHQYNVYLMGASGAVYAVLLMFAVAYPRSKIYVWGILPVPAPILVLVYAAIEIYSEFFSSGSNIAHLTHLAGFGFAWIYSIIRFGESPWKVWKRNFRT
ncbi:MAG: rhomboid family intramembrane serine protease [Treponemataceae bacterium]|nr:rhomboid family intramembrane serine protease [Treponemataceae bacterium]